MANPHAQHGAQVRFDWGPSGADVIGRGAAIVAVVDVLSFTTSLTVAIDQGIEVFPYRFRDDTAAAYARRHDAVLAVGRSHAFEPGQVSLSPASIRQATGIARLVLPSPNGSTIAQHVAAQGATVIGVSLRNVDAAVAWTLRKLRGPSSAAPATSTPGTTAPGDAAGVHATAGTSTPATSQTVAVIAAGERWPDGSLRPALEDLWGAGAFLSGLAAAGLAGFSPEARAAAATYQHDAEHLLQLLPDCASGIELITHGYPEDVETALEINASRLVPVLTGESFKGC